DATACALFAARHAEREEPAGEHAWDRQPDRRIEAELAAPRHVDERTEPEACDAGAQEERDRERSVLPAEIGRENDGRRMERRDPEPAGDEEEREQGVVVCEVMGDGARRRETDRSREGAADEERASPGAIGEHAEEKL